MKESSHKKTLLIAVGNSGRRDDGLGWAFAQWVEKSGYIDLDIVYRYQLQVEDAELMMYYEEVMIVDAYKGKDRGPFFLERCYPKPAFHFSTHALDAYAVQFLCKEIYDKEPQVWLLGIRGEEWKLEEGLSEYALENLALAQEGWRSIFMK